MSGDIDTRTITPEAERRIRAAVAAIEASEVHREPGVPRWEQDDWTSGSGRTKEEAVCNTGCCFAGWLVYLDQGMTFVDWEPVDDIWMVIVDEEFVATRAIELLEMAEDDAGYLFRCEHDTLPKLKAAITGVTGLTFDEAS